MCDKLKLWFRKTGLPLNIIILEAILLLSAVIVSAYDWRNNASNNVSMLVNILSPLAIILTLGVLIIYTYYTYLLAKYQIIPSASFGLVQSPDDPYHFAFIRSNQSKYPIKCWCNLNATTRGTNLLYKGVNGNSKIPSYGNEISPGILKTFPFCCSGLIMHLGSI